MIMTWDAAVRLSATPPALRDIRKTVTVWSLLKASMAFSRASRDMLPSRRTTFTPARSRRNWISSSIEVNCESRGEEAKGNAQRGDTQRCQLQVSRFCLVFAFRISSISPRETQRAVHQDSE